MNYRLDRCLWFRHLLHHFHKCGYVDYPVLDAIRVSDHFVVCQSNRSLWNRSLFRLRSLENGLIIIISISTILIIHYLALSVALILRENLSISVSCLGRSQYSFSVQRTIDQWKTFHYFTRRLGSSWGAAH